MRVHRLLGSAVIVVLLTAVGVLVLRPGDAGTDRQPSVLVAWTPRGLPEGFAAAVSGLDEVTAASVVRGGMVDLVASWDADGNPVDVPPAGMSIPLDALAIDAQTHASVLDPGNDRLADLDHGQALLGESSARLRGLGQGATLALATGQRVTVAGVVDDDLVGHAEIILPAPSPGLDRERFVHLMHTGERADVEAAIRRAAANEPVTVRGPGEQPVLRHGGSLLPQVALKERFGEFVYRPAEGRAVAQDDAWVDTNIRVRRVPILGEVACHREILPLLQAAMTEIDDAGLAELIDPSDYAGCYSPRLIGPGEALSRHAWGIAVDLNATTNGFGDPPTLDRRVVDVMTRWGFAWGGTWMVPDGMHFEYLTGPPHGR